MCYLGAARQATPLHFDPAENLLAVSAFNDNGLKKLVDETADAGTLLRSDFFPGLGWMLTVREPAFRPPR